MASMSRPLAFLQLVRDGDTAERLQQGPQHVTPVRVSHQGLKVRIHKLTHCLKTLHKLLLGDIFLLIIRRIVDRLMEEVREFLNQRLEDVAGEAIEESDGEVGDRGHVERAQVGRRGGGDEGLDDDADRLVLGHLHHLLRKVAERGVEKVGICTKSKERFKNTEHFAKDRVERWH